MKHTGDIDIIANESAPFQQWSNHLPGAADGWIALAFEFDGRDIDLLCEIVETLDWQNVNFGCTIEATVLCRYVRDLVTLRLADRGTRALGWHPADFAVSCHLCLDPSGLAAFVDYFAPDATIDLVADVLVEFADVDVLAQFVLACITLAHTTV